MSILICIQGEKVLGIKHIFRHQKTVKNIQGVPKKGTFWIFKLGTPPCQEAERPALKPSKPVVGSPDDFCDFAQAQAWKFITYLFLGHPVYTNVHFQWWVCTLDSTVESQPFTRCWYANGLSSDGVLACSKFVSLRNNIWFCISSIQRILHSLCCSYVCILSVSKATFTFTFTFHFEVFFWRWQQFLHKIQLRRFAFVHQSFLH